MATTTTALFRFSTHNATEITHISHTHSIPLSLSTQLIVTNQLHLHLRLYRRNLFSYIVASQLIHKSTNDPLSLLRLPSNRLLNTPSLIPQPRPSLSRKFGNPNYHRLSR